PNTRNIARVRSVRSPKILYSTVNTMLIGRCSSSNDKYSLSAFTITGRRLWGQQWSGCRYTSAIGGSDEGIRFAFGSTAIRNSHPQNSGTSAEGAAEEELVQTVHVLDTASGIEYFR